MPGTLRMQVSDSSPCPPLGLQVPERIDYVLSTMRPLASSVALQHIGGRGSGAGSGATAEGSGMSYSDHFAVKVGQHTAGGGGRRVPEQRRPGIMSLHPLSPGRGAGVSLFTPFHPGQGPLPSEGPLSPASLFTF